MTWALPTAIPYRDREDAWALRPRGARLTPTRRPGAGFPLQRGPPATPRRTRSYIPSTGVYRLTATRGVVVLLVFAAGHSCEHPRRVPAPVPTPPAGRARELLLERRHRLGSHLSARRAGPTRRRMPVGHLHLAAVPRGLGLQLPAEFTEVGVRQHTVPVPPDPLRNIRGPPLGGLLDVPPLHTDPLMRVDQAGGELVRRIPAQVRHPRVQSGDAGRGLGTPPRPGLAAGEGTLSRGEPVERRLQVARVLELLAGGGDDQGPHPQVDADRATGTLPIRGAGADLTHHLHGERDAPAAVGTLGDGAPNEPRDGHTAAALAGRALLRRVLARHLAGGLAGRAGGVALADAAQQLARGLVGLDHAHLGEFDVVGVHDLQLRTVHLERGAGAALLLEPGAAHPAAGEPPGTGVEEPLPRSGRVAECGLVGADEVLGDPRHADRDLTGVPVGPLGGVLPLRPGLAQVEVAGDPGGRLQTGGLLGLAGVQRLGDPLEAPVVREAGATSVGGERALLPGGRVEREHVGLLDQALFDGHRGSPPLGWPGLA